MKHTHTNVTAMTTRVAPQQMIIDGSIIESTVTQATNLIATSGGDNGGFFFPVAGIGSLAALILFLAPPLKED